MFITVQEKFEQLLWNTQLRSAPWHRVIFIRFSRILYGTIRDLKGGLPSLRAMSLVYTTLLSLVPLLAVSFSVLKGFGVHNLLEPTLVGALEPLGEKGKVVSDNIISFVDNMKVGVLGSIGLVVLFFTVLSLVKKIESAFNFTWRITVTRNIYQRFSNYISVILVGPITLFVAATINASFKSSNVVTHISTIEPFGSIILLLGTLLPYVLTVFSLTLIYILVPNTRVRFTSALYGAIIATIIWKLVGAMFTAFIVDSTNYTAIYSGFAILIIFMLWLYASWLIVLTGASIAYYHQNPDRISNQSQVLRLSCQLREKLALTSMQLIACRFHHGDKPWTLKELAKQIHISEPALQMILDALVKAGLITTTGNSKKKYLPSQSLENIRIEHIMHAARSAEETHYLRPADVTSGPQVDEMINKLESAISTATSGKSLKDLV